MKKNFKFIVAAIAAVAMIGCTKDGERAGKIKEGVATNAIIKVALPGQSSKKAGTRAYDDIVTGTVGESNIQDAWVFIFNKNTGRLTQKAELDVAAGAVTPTTVATTTGPKYVFVAINAEANGIVINDTKFPVDNAGTATTGIMLDAFMKTEIILDLENNLPVTANQFLMSGFADDIVFEAPTVAVPNPTANSIEIGIGRAVAKVFMKDKPNVSALAATEQITFTSLHYKTMNNPIKGYAFQAWTQKPTGYTPFGTINNVIDGNGTPRSDYYRKDAAYVAEGNANGIYVPENWNTISYARNATSLLVRGQVTFGDKTKVINNDGSAATYVDGQTFWRVFDKTTGKWLDAYFGQDPDLATVKIMASHVPNNKTVGWSLKKTADTRATTSVDFEFFKAVYTNAQCYWTYALFNPEQNNRHVVARNDAFMVTIATIKDIGASKDTDDNDDDGVIPENPVIDEIEVDVTIDIDMLKWHGIDQEADI